MCFKFLDFFTAIYMNRTVRKGAIDEARNIYVVYQSTWGTLLCFCQSLCGIYIFLCQLYAEKFVQGPLCEIST